MLWGLAIFYGGVVWILEFRKRRRDGRIERIVVA
jgi:hypothetical protein